MSETREILEQSIEDHQEAIDKAKRKLEDLETTYSIGDRFKIGSRKYILSLIDDRVAMISLNTGETWSSYDCYVDNSYHISQKELDGISNSHFTRYWDSQRKELTK